MWSKASTVVPGWCVPRIYRWGSEQVSISKQCDPPAQPSNEGSLAAWDLHPEALLVLAPGTVCVIGAGVWRAGKESTAYHWCPPHSQH